jgi:hypothetical protein
MEGWFPTSGIKFKLVDRTEWWVDGDKMVAELRSAAFWDKAVLP